MNTLTLKLPSVSAVKDFTAKISKLEGDFDIGNGRYIVDARSIMGIFSLDLSKPLTLTIHTENPDEVIKALNEFIVK